MGSDQRRLTGDEVATAVAQLEGWQVVDDKLQRDFRFANFVDAMAFMNSVAVWAEEHNHHPEWSNVYNKVLVRLTTHDVGGISSLDVALAQRMNELAAG